jgi:hypothetical protein
MKKCIKCQEIKTEESFSWQYKKQLRRQSICKDCTKKVRDSSREVFNRRAREKKERERGYCKMRYSERFLPLYLKTLRDEVISSHKEQIRTYQATYNRVNRESRSIKRRERLKEDSLFKFKTGVRNCIGLAFSRRTEGSIVPRKGASTLQILGCSFEEFVIYITSQFTEGMTLINYGQWHLDHIVPLATAKTREDVVRLNHYTNFQPLWAKDNLSKGAKIL